MHMLFHSADHRRCGGRPEPWSRSTTRRPRPPRPHAREAKQHARAGSPPPDAERRRRDAAENSAQRIARHRRRSAAARSHQSARSRRARTRRRMCPRSHAGAAPTLAPLRLLPFFTAPGGRARRPVPNRVARWRRTSGRRPCPGARTVAAAIADAVRAGSRSSPARAPRRRRLRRPRRRLRRAVGQRWDDADGRPVSLVAHFGARWRGGW